MTRPTRPRHRRITSICAAVTIALGVGLANTGQARADTDTSVQPVAECVMVNGDGTFTAFFGYRNSSDATRTVSGARNAVRGGSSSGTPRVFRPGRTVAAFSVTSNGDRISWVLDGSTISVTPSYTPCSTNPSVPEAPVALMLMLAPAALTSWWLHRRRPRPC